MSSKIRYLGRGLSPDQPGNGIKSRACPELASGFENLSYRAGLDNNKKIACFIMIAVLFILLFITGCLKSPGKPNQESPSQSARKLHLKPTQKPTNISNLSSQNKNDIKITIPKHWFKFRGNLRNTGTNSNTTGPDKPVLKWKFRAKHEIMSSPSFSSCGDIFIGSHDGNIYKVDQDGKGSIFFHTKETITSSPLIVEYYERILWGNFNGYFYCVDDKGKLQFKLNTWDWIPSSPAITEDGKILFTCRDGFLYCLDMTGDLEWKFEIGKQDYEIQSSPAIFENSVIVGSATGFVYRIGFDGNLIKKFKTGGGVYASPAVDKNGNIFTGSWDGMFYCIDKNGKLVWKYETGSKITSSASLTIKKQVVFGAHDGRVYSLDRKGKLLWKFNTGKSVESSPASDRNGNIYIGSDVGKMFALTPRGKKIWEFETKKPILSSPAIGESGEIVFGCEDKYIYCICDK